MKILNFTFKVLKKLKLYKLANLLINIKHKIILKKLEKIGKDIIIKYKNKNIKKENNTIWILWYQGEEQAPEIVKESIKSVRKFYDNVIVLDEKNLEDYIKIDNNILSKFKKGLITKTHFSDIVRMKLLSEHGGYWFDSTIYLTNKVDLGTLFFTPKLNPNDLNNRFQVSKGAWCGFCIGGTDITLYNFCYDFFVKYWKENDKLIDYYLIDYVIKLAYNNLEFVKNQIDQNEYNNSNIFKLESIINESYDENMFKELTKENHIHKLSYKIKINEDYNNFYYKVIKKCKR